MNHFTEAVPVLAWLLVAAVAVLVAAVLFGAIRATAGPGTRKRRRHPRLHAVAMVLGEYAARARERLAAAFRDSEYEEYDDEDSCPECGRESPFHSAACSLCPVLDDDDQPRPGGSPLSGPGPSTDLGQEPTEAEELAFLQAIRDDGPRAVSAALLPVDDGYAIVTRKPVNPWVNPAFQHSPGPDVTPAAAGGQGQTPHAGPGAHPGFWPMPLAWGQHDVRRTMARDHDDTDIISQPRIVARRDIATRPYGFDHMLRSAPLRQLEAGVW